MELNDLIGRPDRWARLFGWTTLVGLLCGLIGPYGSYLGNGASRICFWVLLFWAGTLIVWPSLAGALYMAQRKGLPPIFAGIGAALAACIPLALVAAGICSLFWPVHASGIRPQEWYTLTVVLALPAAGLAYWMEYHRFRSARWTALGSSDPGSSDSAAIPKPGALPEHLLDLILCLQMEDHHVRYFTAGGSQLHLTPMRDAVRQLGERGFQVHRSWWVARSAVRESTGDSRALGLVLSNGLTVPVSRSRVAAVRAAGWLDSVGSSS